MTASGAPRRDTADLLRWSLIGLAALATAGTVVELASLRHWNGFLQVIPWIVLGVLAVLIALMAARPGRAAIRLTTIERIDEEDWR